ncbi:MAG TPA: hypothetical protein VF892_15405, partial [Pseudonocardiaceae bacterium]
LGVELVRHVESLRYPFELVLTMPGSPGAARKTVAASPGGISIRRGGMGVTAHPAIRIRKADPGWHDGKSAS